METAGVNMNEYRVAWERAFDYSGLSTRQEFWPFVMVMYLIIFVIGIVETIAFDHQSNLSIAILAALVHIPVALPAGIRRLRDAGCSNTLIFGIYLVSLIPVVNFGTLVAFAFPSKDLPPEAELAVEDGENFDHFNMWKKPTTK